MRWLLVLLVAVGVWAQEPHCPKVTFLDLADHSEIWAENPYAIDSTLTLEFVELTNVGPSPALGLGEKHTWKVPAGARLKLFDLTALDPAQRYRYNWNCHWMWGTPEARPDGTVYRLPYEGQHRVIQGFHGTFSHQGELEYAVDFDLPAGSKVLAAREGTVVLTEDRFERGGVDKAFWLTANYVIVRHADGTLANYDHLQKNGVAVQVGQKVKAGDLLGYSGSTGYSGGPHLHFMVYRARDGYQRESFPMKFEVNGQAIEPVQGGRY